MNILPKEFLEHSKEYYLEQVSIKSQIIYLVFILAVIFALLALPFIKIDTFTQARGIVKTYTEQHIIYAPVSASIQQINIVENGGVKRGDTLVVFQNEHIKSEIIAQKYNLELYELYVYDLNKLLRGAITDGTIHVKLQSELISKESSAFQERVKEALFYIDINEKKYNRYQELLKNEFASEEEFESIKHVLDLAKSKYNQIISNSKSDWQARLRQYEQEIKFLKAELINLYQPYSLSPSLPKIWPPLPNHHLFHIVRLSLIQLILNQLIH